MHIYISKPNEEWLRKQTGSMSGIINAFLDAEREADEDVPPVAPKLKVPSPVKPAKLPALKLAGITTADQLEEPECPRHHVAKSMCLDRH